MAGNSRIVEKAGWHNRQHVFASRTEAGRELAALLSDLADTDALVFAIPAGGVPVAVALARTLELNVDLAVVNSVLHPGDDQASFGAIAFDGTVLLDHDRIAAAGLDAAAVDRDIAAAREAIEQRQIAMRGNLHMPAVRNRVAVVVDEGVGSGLILSAALRAVHSRKPSRLIAAVPTGHPAVLERIAEHCDQVCCPNVRDDEPFSVADAYEHWTPLGDVQAMHLLHDFVHQRS